jgi:hypothetical protein
MNDRDSSSFHDSHIGDLHTFRETFRSNLNPENMDIS